MKNIGKTLLLFIGDTLILIGSFWITLFFGFYNNLTSDIMKGHLIPFTILYTIWIVVIFLFNLYDIKLSKPTPSNIRNMGQALIVCLLIGVLFFYGFSNFLITPKINLIINILSFGLLFFVWRRLFFLVFAKNFKKNIVFLTPLSDTHADKLIKHIKNNPQTGYHIVGAFLNPEEFFNYNGSVHEIIVSKFFLNDSKVFTQIYKKNIPIIEMSQAYEDMLSKIPIELIDESWFIHKLPSQTNLLYRFIKRIIDVLVSTIGIIIFSPFLITASICIKIEDGGPIFYLQKRNGQHNKVFNIIKLRSMIVNSEEDGAVWAQKNDSRITRVGKILRKTHIDELPQLFNILKGDISLVGPRPERPEFVSDLEEKIPFYHLRHTIKPGFTGWGQIKFRYARSVEDSKEKFEYDLYYLKNKNILLDIGIIVKTIQIIFTH